MIKAKKVFENLDDILKPKEGASEELEKWSFKNLMTPPDSEMEAEGLHNFLILNKNLGKLLNYKGHSDIKNIVDFEYDNMSEEFPGDEQLFSEIAGVDINIIAKIDPDFAGGLRLYYGTVNGDPLKSRAIYYAGGMISGYIARKEWIKR